MSDFWGKFIVSFARCFLKEISYIKRLQWFGQELVYFSGEKADLELELSKVEPFILIWCFFNSEWPVWVLHRFGQTQKMLSPEDSTTHLFRVRLGNKLCGSTLIHRGKSGRTGEVSVGTNKTGNKIWKCLKIRDVLEKIEPLILETRWIAVVEFGSQIHFASGQAGQVLFIAVRTLR